ncbi:MAG: winged helix-turn-helix domain-containing protein, partial [Akkermansiaceae bacterium]|nr:winged helix-turn-helix domain-containing protein [Armatimonadota bacterium]
MGTDGAVVKSSMTAKSESVGTQPVWHLQMLGQFRAIRPDSPASEGVIIDRFQTQKTSLLLAILTHSSRPVSREDLVERLWPDAEPAAGRDRLSQALSWLRRRFESDAALPAGGVFGADRQSVWLLPGAFSTDVAAFDAGVRATRAPSGDTEQVASVIEAALALYAGPLLPGICEEDAVLFREQQRLAGAYEDALRRVVVLHENAGRFPNAVAHARRLLGLNPADEETCARLLRLFARTGEREAALRTVSSFTRRYRDAHGGNSPSNMLQQLAQAVRAR